MCISMFHLICACDITAIQSKNSSVPRRHKGLYFLPSGFDVDIDVEATARLQYANFLWGLTVCLVHELCLYLEVPYRP